MKTSYNLSFTDKLSIIQDVNLINDFKQKNINSTKHISNVKLFYFRFICVHCFIFMEKTDFKVFQNFSTKRYGKEFIDPLTISRSLSNVRLCLYFRLKMKKILRFFKFSSNLNFSLNILNLFSQFSVKRNASKMLGTFFFRKSN